MNGERMAVAPAEWAWISCSDCGHTEPVDGGNEMRKHTLLEHFRTASVNDLSPRVEQLAGPAQMAPLTRRVIDGRVWAVLQGNVGFTRTPAGSWIRAYVGSNPPRPIGHLPMTVPAQTAAALDWWESIACPPAPVIPTDTDPTPNGISRPRVARFLALAGG